MIPQLPRLCLFATLQQQVAGVRSDGRSSGARQLRIALFDRGQDRLMEVQRVFEVDQLRGHHHHIQHGPMNDVKEALR